MKKEAPPAPSRPPVAEPETYIVGLRKLGPRRYCVITGTIANPIVNVSEVSGDVVTDPLEYAAEAMKLAIQKMLLTIP